MVSSLYVLLLNEFCLQVEQKEMDAAKPEDIQVPA
jgi:hypothetical protein